ncbi:GLPGLI family protein [Myroides sp. LJL119]
MRVLFLLLLSSYVGFSQNLVVHYDHQSLHAKPEDIAQKHILSYKDGISYFEKQGDKSADSPDIDNIPKQIQKQLLEDINTLDKKNYYYKDFNNDELLTIIAREQVVDKLIDWDWQITQEVKEIQGLVCTKAVSNFMGYHFEAWYTLEIPVGIGPEYYHGLPGLILHAYNLGSEYKATLIEFPQDLPQIKKPEIPLGPTYSFIQAQEMILKPSDSKPIRKYSIDDNTTIQISIKTRIKK